MSEDRPDREGGDQQSPERQPGDRRQGDQQSPERQQGDRGQRGRQPGDRQRQEPGGSTDDSSDGSFLTHPSVKWTLGRTLGGFFLLSVCLGLSIAFTPDLVKILGLGGELAEAEEYLPAGLATMPWTQLFAILFGVLFWTVAGPFVGAVLGVTSGSGRDAPKSSLAFATAVGAFFGYFVPMVVILVAMTTLNPFSQVGIGGAVVSAFLATIPTTLAAAGMAALSA